MRYSVIALLATLLLSLLPESTALVGLVNRWLCPIRRSISSPFSLAVSHIAPSFNGCAQHHPSALTCFNFNHKYQDSIRLSCTIQLLSDKMHFSQPPIIYLIPPPKQRKSQKLLRSERERPNLDTRSIIGKWGPLHWICSAKWDCSQI